MKARDLLMRVASKIPGIPSDLFEWWNDARDLAEESQRQRIEDEARILTNPQDMTRWITTPHGRRRRPQLKGDRR